jgi:hypothetical protein
LQLADDLGFSGQLRDIVAHEMILDAEENLEAGVGEKGFPVVLRPALLYRSASFALSKVRREETAMEHLDQNTWHRGVLREVDVIAGRAY